MYKKDEYSERIGRAVEPVQLVTISYDLLIDYLEAGKKRLAAGSGDAFVEQLSWARECIGELDSALDMSQPLASDLHELYVYVNGLLIKSAMFEKHDELDEALRIARALGGAFRQVEAEELKKLKIKDVYERESLREYKA